MFGWFKKPQQKRLPVGMTEFVLFCDEFFLSYQDIPDSASMRFALASMIMHLPPDKCMASKEFFATALYKAMANEVAYQFMQEQKTKQKQEVEGGKTETVVNFEEAKAAKEAMNRHPEQEAHS